ncbi:MAG: adenylate/guanylate cyclase domain-containing protein, partial [Acidobacteriota bacterium]
MADLSAFLPWSFNGLAAGLPRGGPRCRIRHGTVLFTDVAGFTPLTEALSVLGREGSEELTRILNAYFTRMISIADQEGGDVLRFGGDSMTLLFPGKAPGRALRAAARMMEAMGAFAKIPTRAGTFSLSMKVGAAAGPVLLGIVGGDAAGYDFYAAGPVLDGATAAEHQALPGEVVLHPSVGGPPPRGLRARTRGGKRLLLGSPATGARRPDHDPPPPGPVLEQVVPRVLHGFADETVLGEHRGTAVLFVRFDGVCVQAIEEGGGAPVRRLHDALEALHKTFSEAARQHGGYLNKLDMGDKGAKALLLFGSPRALENKEEMAVRTALHLLQRARLPEGITLRMGLASAPLFAGPLGAPHRREYTAMGNGINLAARLMQNAGPGQIRCDEATARAVPSIEFRPLATVRLKGLQAPVPIFEPGSEREDGLPDRSERLVEREEVQRRLLACLVRGQGGPLLLRGGPGLGKTALIEWALGALQAKGRPCVRVPLGPHSASKPFAAWRGPLRALLGVSREDGPETVAAALQARVRAESARHAPLLFPLLDLPAEEPAALGTFGPEERKDLTFALLRDLLLEAPGWSVFFDNIQWADPLSLELLALLLDPAGPAPIRVAATLRPGYPKVEARLKGMEPLDLPPLSEKGLLRLLTEGQGFLAPEREVSAWFAQRSQGNPAV